MSMLIKIPDLKPGVFEERPNRYLSKVWLDGKRETVHVHDPGRLKELLYPGNPCLVRYAAHEKRKTDWDMIAAHREGYYILVHSGYHRSIAEAILKSPDYNPFGVFEKIKAEVTYGHSRLDFCLYNEEDEKLWVEVKGCSLSVDGLALFPDAPTVRGSKHLQTLIDIKKSGQRSGVLLLILSEADAFSPYEERDPRFATLFREALASGVEIYPVKVALNSSTGEIFYQKVLPIL